LTEQQAHQLAVGTFVGASELARRSDDPPSVLRQRVTSKGGTTYAACSRWKLSVVCVRGAMQAACQRADEAGQRVWRLKQMNKLLISAAVLAI
jgi:pyrroline-5-carboxylate reductase